ncbi:uncharacterized protein BXZ73DRAFT_77319 [Epithele typhae]|uniref:uncharacterized protein n=1 Tax=Epithele typhae TaxID=378194 RepID=UPI002007CF55|nr:uncharacterized protein BXZ73DRAFT_77319 [Epithele typhae]KAH9933154.1 hypothetical protein BXZ73DRAFT_77319 [Epithele typhae]
MAPDASTCLPDEVQAELRRHATAIHYALRHPPNKATTPNDVLQRWEEGVKNAVYAISELYPKHHAQIPALPKFVLGALYEYDYAAFAAETGETYVPSPWNVKPYGREDPRDGGFPFSYPIVGDDDWKVGFVPLRELQDGWVFESIHSAKLRIREILQARPSILVDDGHSKEDGKRGRTPFRHAQEKRPARAQRLDYVSPPRHKGKGKRAAAEREEPRRDSVESEDTPGSPSPPPNPRGPNKRVIRKPSRAPGTTSRATSLSKSRATSRATSRASSRISSRAPSRAPSRASSRAQSTGRAGKAKARRNRKKQTAPFVHHEKYFPPPVPVSEFKTFYPLVTLPHLRAHPLHVFQSMRCSPCKEHGTTCQFWPLGGTACVCCQNRRIACDVVPDIAAGNSKSVLAKHRMLRVGMMLANPNVFPSPSLYPKKWRQAYKDDVPTWTRYLSEIWRVAGADKHEEAQTRTKPDTLEFRDNGFVPYPVGVATLDEENVAPGDPEWQPNDNKKPRGRRFQDNDDVDGLFETEEDWLEEVRKALEGEGTHEDRNVQPQRPRKRARIRSPDAESDADEEGIKLLPGPSVASFNLPPQVPGGDFFGIPESNLPFVDGHKRWQSRAESRQATMADIDALRTEIAKNNALLQRECQETKRLREDVDALRARVLELEEVNQAFLTASPFVFDAAADFNDPPAPTPDYMANFEAASSHLAFSAAPFPPQTSAPMVSTPPTSTTTPPPPLTPNTMLGGPQNAAVESSVSAHPQPSLPPRVEPMVSTPNVRRVDIAVSPPFSLPLPRLPASLTRLPSYASSSSDEEMEETKSSLEGTRVSPTSRLRTKQASEPLSPGALPSALGLVGLEEETATPTALSGPIPDSEDTPESLGDQVIGPRLPPWRIFDESTETTENCQRGPLRVSRTFRWTTHKTRG